MRLLQSLVSFGWSFPTLPKHSYHHSYFRREFGREVGHLGAGGGGGASPVLLP